MAALDSDAFIAELQQSLANSDYDSENFDVIEDDDELQWEFQGKAEDDDDLSAPPDLSSTIKEVLDAKADDLDVESELLKIQSDF